MMLFDHDFFGSVRCANCVVRALGNRNENSFLTRHNVTVEMALTLTSEEVARTQNAGKKTVAEFEAWKREHEDRYEIWSISHWGLVNVDIPNRGVWS